MKKLWILFICLLFIVACGAKEEVDGDVQESENEAASETISDEEKEVELEEEEGGMEVNKGLLNVEVTLPASFFEGEDLEQIKDENTEEGISEVTQNDDGTVTYKMSKAAHKDWLEQTANGIEESMEELANDEDFGSIENIDVNKNYSEFEVAVDKEAYENSMDSFILFSLAYSGMLYQLIDGASADNYEVVIKLADDESGEEFDTIVFPDALDESLDLE
ncbi:hypothetical protein SH601_00280 [Gracilibacillus sp. S3-1-1]|uniref:Uncharacterized protein n=1 Tax=Gracilibacillus pellucidus TaxID=3095368 RepID=A0ACC6M0E6_9BACI|nr:hypothetical protein [Gracilibacillus sp. S3-1-1]MDX8044409.1 hypothetical protein [Gracilibacillus sp. S3-1-1]